MGGLCRLELDGLVAGAEGGTDSDTAGIEVGVGDQPCALAVHQPFVGLAGDDARASAVNLCSDVVQQSRSSQDLVPGRFDCFEHIREGYLAAKNRSYEVGSCQVEVDRLDLVKAHEGSSRTLSFNEAGSSSSPYAR